MPILFSIVGATGIGKSQLSLKLAEQLNSEIIGVDSRQIYKGFAIGTAQPSALDLKRKPHHMVNFLDPTKAYSAGDFCRDVKEIIKDNSNRNYILVGGTGLYLQSLMLGLPQIPKIDNSIREFYEKEFKSGKEFTLYKMAQEVDPESMINVDIHNVQRIIRILEVWESTQRKLSEWQKERKGGIGNIPVFWLKRSRENLYSRIDKRVDKMMKDGWIEEIKTLAQTVPLESPAWQSLGYKELLFAKNAQEINSILEIVKRKTRNYAKRQLTYFRYQLKSIAVDMELNENPFDFIINELLVSKKNV